MIDNFVSVPVEEYAALVTAMREAEMLKRLMEEKKYIGIDGKDIALVCQMLRPEKED